jgi:FG-GAP-like repeat
MRLRSMVCAFLLSVTAPVVHLQASSNPVPFLGQPLAPVSAAPGSQGLTLTVRGTGFVSGSLVQWNGQALPTTFASGESLNATVPASDLAKAGSAKVTVVTPGPGGGTSNFATFEITAPTPSAILFEIRTNTPTPTNSLVTGDFNADGKLDLAVSTGSTLSILLGKGDGTFNVTTSSTTAQFVGTLVTGDFNGDGNLDFAFPDPNTSLLHLLAGHRDGTFTEVSTTKVGANPVWVAAADFNGDGNLDLAVVNQADGSVSILLGNGDGTFSSKPTVKVGTTPNAITIADVNGDGKLDLAVVNSDSNSVSVLLGAGDGTFTLKSSPSTGTSPFGIVASDFNGDGKVDLAVTNQCGNGKSCGHLAYGSVAVLLGAGDGTFAVSSKVLTRYHKPLGIAAADFNADGKTDLVVTGLSESSALVLPGNGKGGFGTPIGMNGFAPPFAAYVAVGDFNEDGRLDFAENNPSAIGGNTSVSVQTQSAVAFYPSVLKFPPQQVGTTSPAKKMTFSNIGVAPVDISKVQVSGFYSGTNDCPAKLPVGAYCTLSVTFSPQFVGLTGGLVSVTDNALGVVQTAGLEGKGK